MCPAPRKLVLDQDNEVEFVANHPDVDCEGDNDEFAEEEAAMNEELAWLRAEEKRRKVAAMVGTILLQLIEDAVEIAIAVSEAMSDVTPIPLQPDLPQIFICREDEEREPEEFELVYLED